MFYSRYLQRDSTSPRHAKNTKAKAPSRQPSGSRLVWHSNIGASNKNRKQQAYKPLQRNKDGLGKAVHFSTIEVQPFHFDWSLAGDVFYTRKEITAMGQKRFDDAAKIKAHNKSKKERQQSSSTRNGSGASSSTKDDTQMCRKSREKDIESLLSLALGDQDDYDGTSIRGIEHFVYSQLQQEMIRRKKEVQREVLGYVKSKRPDPQGWRLAEHSRSHSQWARNVAQEKGLKYCSNNANMSLDLKNSTSMEKTLQQSRDELEGNIRALRGASSFSQEFTEGTRSHSFDNEPSRRSTDLGGIKEDDVDSKNDSDLQQSIDRVNITDDEGGLDRPDASTGIEVSQREPDTSTGPTVQTSRSESMDDEDDGVTLDVPANVLPLPSKEVSGKSELRESAQSTCQETGEE